MPPHAPLGPAALAALGLALAAAPLWADPWPSIPIPPENGRRLTAPAPRPPPGDVEARARRLFEALKQGTPGAIAAAEDFFLPREPFIAIKDMSGAERYFRALTRWYREDIATYRARRSDWSTARFEGFTLSRRCAWMARGREANRLPYWSCYGSTLRVAFGPRVERFDVRVMIHWGQRWYTTHLGPIRH